MKNVRRGSWPRRTFLLPLTSVRRLFLFQPGAHSFDGPLLVRKLSGFQLRVNQVTVDAELEASAALGNQFELLDLLFVSAQQLARQTDGLRLVVSHGAVLEFHLHCFSPFATPAWAKLVR